MTSFSRLFLSAGIVLLLLGGGSTGWAENLIYYAYGLTNFIGLDPTLGLYAIDSQGATQYTIANGYFFSPTFSPDGDIMAFTSLYPGLPMMAIYTVNRDGMFNLLTPPIGNSSKASFSPDGEHVIYQVNIPPGGGDGLPDDGDDDDDDDDPRLPKPKPTNKTGFTGLNINPAQYINSIKPAHWPYDMFPLTGSYVAIAHLDGSDQPWAFHKAIPGQGGLEMWTSPSWHPKDVNTIAVSIMGTPHTRVAEARIFVMNPDGSNQRVLYDPPYDFWSGQALSFLSPVYSPGGESIAYAYYIFDMARFRHYWSLFVMRSDGSDAPGLQLTPWDLLQVDVFTGGIDYVSWSSDGEWLVFQVAVQANNGVPLGSDLFKVRRDGSGLTRLTTNNRSVNPCFYPGDQYEEFFPPLQDDSTPTMPAATETSTPLPTWSPTPSPTLLSQPTPTPTTLPVATNTPLPTPTHTPTATAVWQTPTITPENPTPAAKDFIIHPFDKNDLAACGWKEIPGGFTGAPAGHVGVNLFFSHPISSSPDDKGLEITVQPKQVAFVHTLQPIDSQGKPVLLRLTVRANRKEACVVLGAMKGTLTDGSVDGSLAMLMPASAQSFVDNESTSILLYQPDQGTWITPLIQVASTAQEGSVTILIDRLEIQVLDKNEQYSGMLFYKE